MQICTNGNVVLTEPLSFETMDKKNMGNVLKEPISCMIFKWNWIEPLDEKDVKEYCNNMIKLENPKLPDDKRAELQTINEYIDMKKLFLNRRA